MATGPWGSRFVGTHFLITESKTDNEPWEMIPPSWNEIRFDAIDILFISPFSVKTDDFSFILGDGPTLNVRFGWVIRAARSKNPKIKIILEQFYHDSPQTDYRAFHGDQSRIQRYADSVAGFIGTWYNKTIPALTGHGEGASGGDLCLSSRRETPSRIFPRQSKR